MSTNRVGVRLFLSSVNRITLLRTVADVCKAHWADRLGADAVVETRDLKRNGDATRLDYVMRQDQGGRRISDMHLDGSIQLAVHPSEFHSILQREGVDGLVMALNRKVDLLRKVAKAS